MFEPVYGSALDIDGLGIANPIAAIWAGAMMPDYLGETRVAEAVLRAIRATSAAGRTLTPDLGGTVSTVEVRR